jgi:outer membrane protein OmpA-like peptidoglycan-associated protein
MSPLRLLAAAGLVASLAACASGPATNVTLLAGEGSAPVGAVAVLDPKTEADRGVLDTANTGAVADARKFKAVAVDPGRYAAIAGALPPAASHYTLYFLEGTTTLTPESAPLYRQMLAEVAQRPGAEVQVTGHTDTVGSGPDNDRLSIRRATEIRDALVQQGLDPSITRATGRGERELLVATPDNTAEPKNRRVEVTVR